MSCRLLVQFDYILLKPPGSLIRRLIDREATAVFQMKRLETFARAVFALGAAAALASATRMQVPANVLMGIQQDRSVAGALVAYLEPIFGVNPKSRKTGQLLQTILDVNFADVYLLDGKTSSKGIDCVEEKACGITADQRVSCKYLALAAADCSPAATVLRFYPISLPDAGGQRMQFKLLNATAEWKEQLGQKSVLGLHRASPFWNYMRDAFDEGQFEFSLVYQLEDKAEALVMDKSELADSFWIINGRFEANDPIMQTQDPVLDSGPWTLRNTAVNLSVSVQGPVVQGGACVDNIVNAYVLLQDPQPVAQAIFKRLCGSAEGCERKNSNLKNLQAWAVSYSGSGARGKKQASDRVLIEPDEFVNFLDNGTAVLGVAALDSSAACSRQQAPSAAFGLGRLFLSKAELVIRYNSSSDADQPGNFSIGFNKLTYPDDTIFLIILFILAVLIVILAVVIFLARVLHGKKQLGSIETVEDSYKNVNDS